MTGKDLKNESGVSIELGGKRYHLVLDFNALCDLEEKFGDLQSGLSALSAGKMRDVRFFLCIMLRHDCDEMEEREAGKLITPANMQQVMDALGKAMTESMPEPKNVKSPQET